MFKLHLVKANEELSLLELIPILLNQCVFLYIDLNRQVKTMKIYVKYKTGRKLLVIRMRGNYG